MFIKSIRYREWQWKKKLAEYKNIIWMRWKLEFMSLRPQRKTARSRALKCWESVKSRQSNCKKQEEEKYKVYEVKRKQRARLRSALRAVKTNPFSFSIISFHPHFFSRCALHISYYNKAFDSFHSKLTCTLLCVMAEENSMGSECCLASATAPQWKWKS